jgi:dipeptidyl aminopeptidase/acylaminoacyl peptidase
MPPIMIRLWVVAGLVAGTGMMAEMAAAQAQTAQAQTASAQIAQTPPAPAPAATPQAAAAGARPTTEVFLASLTMTNGKLTIGQPANISNNPGYDNQPQFTPDGGAVLFTSVRGGATPSQSDIYRYDIDAARVVRVTETPESEYSPTVTPDGKHISVIRVEPDGTQRLWQFTIEGREPALVLTDIKPVGYHAWADDHTLALFVLGKPATLQLADTKTGKAEILKSDIGRSIQRIPGRGTISFVTRDALASNGATGGGSATATGSTTTGPGASASGSTTATGTSTTGTGASATTASAPAAQGRPSAPYINELDPKTKAMTPLVRAVAGSTEADCVWTPDGQLLMAHAGALYAWKRGDTDWTRLADLEALGLAGVTRLAVSPKGDRIAFVTIAR